MIFGNIKNTEELDVLEDKVRKAFFYAINTNLVDSPKGTYKIDGDNLFVNIVEYDTDNKENRFWEAHREYLDVHIMLKGTERIDVGVLNNMETKPYVEKDDFVEAFGKESAQVILNEGDFLVCYPHDAHMTAIKVGEKAHIKKAIFKVKI